MKRVVTDSLVLVVSSVLLLSACASEPEPKPTAKPVAMVETPKEAPEPKVVEPAEPSASFEVVSMSEHGDKGDLEEGLEKELSALDDCYVKQLETEPGIAGDVRFELNISPAGRVDAVTVIGGTLDEDGLEGCTKQVFEGVEVPAPKSGKDANAQVVISYVAG